ncbi:MAG: DUF416 family protein [Cyanobacteriota bacterium]|nr:DUF416 family protein [Cyanobacteriota bacterium]
MVRSDFYDIREGVLELSFLKQVAFAASCCERLLPNYSAFSSEEGRGNYQLLRYGLDRVWDFLIGQPNDLEQLTNRLEHECMGDVFSEEIIPNSPYAYEAELASIAVFDTLNSCSTRESEFIVRAHICTVDTITEHVRILREIDNPEWPYERTNEEQEEDVFCHPFVIRELAKEREDLYRLRELETLNQEIFQWLRSSFDNDGKSSIDLS